MWLFPSNNYGDINGIGNSGVETFQGTPLKSLAREICQNSLDASQKDKSVIVEFMPFNISTKDFPGIESLKEAFQQSKEFWRLQETRKATDFFERGLSLMDSINISFLRISDFNTTGLTGSDKEYNSPWCNLTKSSGASDKGGTSGGSFGIGKFAPYACSDFRTVFYSTLDIEGKTASQGISRITSFRRKDENQITTGVGYYGDDKNKPFLNQIHLDPSFKRKKNQIGTDIYISGFKYYEMDWKTDVVASILDGFLYAIYSDKLVVRIDDIVISKETIPVLLEEYYDALTENAKNYYTVMSSSETTWYEENYKNHGIIKLGLIIKPEMHRKVAMIRKTGMKIFDRGNISGNIPFAGIMLIEGDDINNYLRNLENPQHTKWEPDRIEPKAKVPEAKLYVKGLIDFIKDSIEKLKGEGSAEEIDPAVGEFLPDEPDPEKEANKTTTESLTDKIKTFEKKVLPPRKSNKDVEEEFEGKNEGGAGHTDGKGSSGRHGKGFGDENGKGGSSKGGTREISKVAPVRARTVCINKDKGEYSLTFIPRKSATDGHLEMFLSAESGRYEANIVSAIGLGQKGIIVEGNKIKGLTFVENSPIRVRMKIDFYDYCSMEVEAYGYKI